MFEPEVVALAVKVSVEFASEGVCVIGMDPFEPFMLTRADLVLGVSEHLLPAGRKVDGIGADIEDTVIGAWTARA